MPTSSQLLEVISIQTDIAKLGLDLGGVITLVTEKTLHLVGAEGAAIEFAEGEDMVYRAAAGNASPFLGLRLKRDSSLSGLCVKMGTTLRCDDSENDSRVDRNACRKIGLRSMIVMPLLHNGAAVGVLKAMSGQPNKFSENDMNVLGLLSEVVAASMFFAAKYDTDELFHRATHDGMTGLANRSLFMDRLRSVISQSERDQRPASVLMIDMNGLKKVNDTYGHRAGDAMIIEFSNRMRNCARVSDTVARLGGDEFGVILTPIDLPEGVEAAVQRLESELKPSFSFEGKSHHISASIGSSIFPKDSSEVQSLVEIADQRMYQVKAQHHMQQSSTLH